MDTWTTLFICCALAAAAAASVVNDSNDGDLKNNQLHIHNIAYIRKELYVYDCEKVVGVKDDSLKTVITTLEVALSCPKDIKKVLSSSDGVIVILNGNTISGEESAELLSEHQNYCIFPNNLFSEFDQIKVYYNCDTLVDILSIFIMTSKYEEAVELSKYLFKSTRKEYGKDVIVNLVNRFLEQRDTHFEAYKIMSYAFKLKENNENIVGDCFPEAFIRILKGDWFKVVEYECCYQTKGVLKLSPDKNNQYRWLYVDSTVDSTTTDVEVYWKCTPTWNTTLNSVVFEIENPHYKMVLTLKDSLGLFTKARQAVGEYKSIDPTGRFAWHLLPSYKNYKLLVFQFIDISYNSCLTELDYNNRNGQKIDVVGIENECKPDLRWSIEFDADYDHVPYYHH